MPYDRINIDNGTVYYAASSSITTTSGSFACKWAGTWDGTTGLTGWSTLDGGINTGYARGIQIIDANRIYLYGNFSSLGSSNVLSYGSNFNIAMWDGTQWNALGTLGATNGTVRDVCYDATNNEVVE